MQILIFFAKSAIAGKNCHSGRFPSFQFMMRFCTVLLGRHFKFYSNVAESPVFANRHDS
jgi:hypothetical protein